MNQNADDIKRLIFISVFFSILIYSQMLFLFFIKHVIL
jgi:hypothetical protein